MRDPDPGGLHAFDDGSELRLIDSRRAAPHASARLYGPARTAYNSCDDIASAAVVAAAIEREHPDEQLSLAAVTALLDKMTKAQWMVADGDLYLSLATISAEAPIGREGVQLARECVS